MEISEQAYERQTPSLKYTRAYSNRYSHVSRLPTARRAVILSARQRFSLSERGEDWCRKKSYCMAPDTPLRSVKYLRNNLKSTPCSGQIKITKTVPEAKQNVVSLSSSTSASRSPTSCIMMILFRIKRREKLVKNRKSESAKSDPENFGNNYGIGHFKICGSKLGLIQITSCTT